ncbi:MAG TPA: HNH endonuclease, partial [Gammaproteobacteria bacterium]|nr:HNH endonuclease [Gammaproteobacteria bacterium]
MPKKTSSPDNRKLDEIVAAAQRNRASREQDYRARSLKMYPW